MTKKGEEPEKAYHAANIHVVKAKLRASSELRSKKRYVSNWWVSCGMREQKERLDQKKNEIPMEDLRARIF